MRTSVDLPEPFGPSTAVNDPLAISKVASDQTFRRP